VPLAGAGVGALNALLWLRLRYTTATNALLLQAAPGISAFDRLFFRAQSGTADDGAVSSMGVPSCSRAMQEGV
jgi:hypothetical protein